MELVRSTRVTPVLLLVVLIGETGRVRLE